MLFLSMMPRVDMITFIHLTTGAVVSQGVLLRKRMRVIIMHLKSLIMRMLLLKILLIHVAMVILTESLVSLIFGLDISLVIIFRVNDLELLINLTVSIHLDKRSILDVVLL